MTNQKNPPVKAEVQLSVYLICGERWAQWSVGKQQVLRHSSFQMLRLFGLGAHTGQKGTVLDYITANRSGECWEILFNRLQLLKTWQKFPRTTNGNVHSE